MKSYTRVVAITVLFSLFAILQVSKRINDNGIPKSMRSLFNAEGSNADYFEFNKISLGNKKIDKIYDVDERELAKDSKVNWSNLVFMIPMYDDHAVQKLIEAQFENLLKRVGKGADFIFVTDVDDLRSMDNIFPSMSQTEVKIHLHRSASPKEGTKARSKVIDMLYFAYKKFKNKPNKKYFIKMDPDSYVVPHSLMSYLNELRAKTHTKPVDFGYGLCHTSTHCYTEGGLYGMNREGFLSTVEYLKGNPEIFNEFIKADGRFIEASSDNYLEHEDVFTSYAFFKATGYPVITSDEISMDFADRDSGTYPISIHPVKKFRDHYVLDKIFYNDLEEQRKEKVSMKTLQSIKSMLKIVGYGRMGKYYEERTAGYTGYNQARKAGYSTYNEERKAGYSMFNQERKAGYSTYNEERKAGYSMYNEARKAGYSMYNEARKAGYSKYNEARKAGYSTYNQERKAEIQATEKKDSLLTEESWSRKIWDVLRFPSN